MNILYLIPARGGSKGILRKNIRQLGNLPLVAYRIISAKKCKYSGRIIVSTDDLEIAEVAKRYGAEVPFQRPAELANDTASSLDVILHALNWLKENDHGLYDYIFLLQPTSPFVSFQDLNQALDLIIEKQADTLLSLKETKTNRCLIEKLDDQGKLSHFFYSLKDLQKSRRQDFSPEYTLNGGMYIAKWEYFIKNKMFYALNSIPYLMDEVHSIDLDEPLDLEFAQFLIDRGLIDLSLWKEEVKSLN